MIIRNSKNSNTKLISSPFLVRIKHQILIGLCDRVICLCDVCMYIRKKKKCDLFSSSINHLKTRHGHKIPHLSK